MFLFLILFFFLKPFLGWVLFAVTLDQADRNGEKDCVGDKIGGAGEEPYDEIQGTFSQPLQVGGEAAGDPLPEGGFHGGIFGDLLNV